MTGIADRSSNASLAAGLLWLMFEATRTSRGLQAPIRNLTCRLTEPAFETPLAEPRVIGCNKCSLAQLAAEVARVRVRDNFARIVVRSQLPSNEVVETKPLRPRY